VVEAGAPKILQQLKDSAEVVEAGAPKMAPQVPLQLAVRQSTLACNQEQQKWPWARCEMLHQVRIGLAGTADEGNGAAVRTGP
jgi:hypothetical protein